MLLIVVSLLHLQQGSWVSEMEEQLAVMGETLKGELGVCIKDMSDNRVLSFNCDENWYLASTIKIPVAIAILKKAEAGEI